MNTAITLIIAFVVIILHVWLCRRSPKLWYLGGIIPLLWISIVAIGIPKERKVSRLYFTPTFSFSGSHAAAIR